MKPLFHTKSGSQFSPHWELIYTSCFEWNKNTIVKIFLFVPRYFCSLIQMAQHFPKWGVTHSFKTWLFHLLPLRKARAMPYALPSSSWSSKISSTWLTQVMTLFFQLWRNLTLFNNQSAGFEQPSFINASILNQKV